MVPSNGGVKLARISHQVFKTKAGMLSALDKRAGSSMPKEEPGSSEVSSCATSSKNDKNKSNHMTLLAIRDTKEAGDSSGRSSSRCSSEKDSGYSDGSDWQQTDVEDQQSNKSQSGVSECAEISQPGETKDPEQGNPGNATLMPAGRKVQPIYIINNMVLKQPAVIQKRGHLRNGCRETGSSGAAQVILCQRPRLLPATIQLSKPLSRKSNITGKKINVSYLPILNSYPRIAPHPSKKSSVNDESQSLSKRVCTEHRSDDTPVTRSPPQQHLYKHPKLAAVTSGLPCSSSTRDSRSSSSPVTVSSSQGSPSGSSLYTTSSILATRGLHRNSTTSSRHRFLNTLQILRQSGLLDITLRTKELLRQSSATEQNIAQLRQHTELLCQAASNPCPHLSDTTAWEHLHRAMAESGNYPNLKNLQLLCHPDSASPPASISTSDAKGPGSPESSEAPLPRLLTAVLDPNRDKSSEKVTFMPPDSSTG